MKILARVFVALLLLGNLLLLAGLSVHVVRAPGKTPAIVAKDHLTLVDTFLDTASWTPADLANPASAAARITQAGKGDLLAHIAPQVSSAGQAAAAPQAAQSQRDAGAQKAAAPQDG